MQMMAMFGSARERTEAEFRELLAAAGFDLLRVIATASPVSILEAAPAEAHTGRVLPRPAREFATGGQESNGSPAPHSSFRILISQEFR
jgi:hypothetical protein